MAENTDKTQAASMLAGANQTDAWLLDAQQALSKENIGLIHEFIKDQSVLNDFVTQLTTIAEQGIGLRSTPSVPTEQVTPPRNAAEVAPQALSVADAASSLAAETEATAAAKADELQNFDDIEQLVDENVRLQENLSAALDQCTQMGKQNTELEATMAESHERLQGELLVALDQCSQMDKQHAENGCLQENVSAALDQCTRMGQQNVELEAAMVRATATCDWCHYPRLILSQHAPSSRKEISSALHVESQLVQNVVFVGFPLAHH